jgi:hypothetical protein
MTSAVLVAGASGLVGEAAVEKSVVTRVIAALRPRHQSAIGRSLLAPAGCRFRRRRGFAARAAQDRQSGSRRDWRHATVRA